VPGKPRSPPPARRDGTSARRHSTNAIDGTRSNSCAATSAPIRSRPTKSGNRSPRTHRSSNNAALAAPRWGGQRSLR
jgi:hypothetical protein